MYNSIFYVLIWLVLISPSPQKNNSKTTVDTTARESLYAKPIIIFCMVRMEIFQLISRYTYICGAKGGKGF